MIATENMVENLNNIVGTGKQAFKFAENMSRKVVQALRHVAAAKPNIAREGNRWGGWGVACDNMAWFILKDFVKAGLEAPKRVNPLPHKNWLTPATYEYPHYVLPLLGRVAER